MTSKQKWTPGPWKREGSFVYALDGGINRFSANVQNDNHDASAEEIEATAKLISLAPEMAEALRELVAESYNTCRDNFCFDKLAGARKQAESLLSRLDKEERQGAILIHNHCVQGEDSSHAK